MEELISTGNQIESKDRRGRILSRLYDLAFLVGWGVCLLVGRFPQYTTILSGILLLCVFLSFFSDNFYLYAALFMYMRYKMLLGETPVFRVYSYLMVLKFLMELPRIKFRVAYLPAILVFSLHCIFATGRSNLRLGLNVLVDMLIIYIVLLKVLQNDDLTRKFLLAFLLGAVSSGIYGWTAEDAYVDINVRGAGATEVNRNFGSLDDVNYASLFYNMSIFTALFLKNVPKWAKVVFVGLFSVLLLQTASLSGLITLVALGVCAVILKFRKKSIGILLIFGFAAVVILGILLSIPAFRQLPAIGGLLIRIAEKLSYISIGRWDMLTTDRANIWAAAMDLFATKSWFGKLFGGSVITVMLIDTSLFAYDWACHQSAIQSLLNFGILGTLVVYLTLLGAIVYRSATHFLKPVGYENEDIKILQILFGLSFVIFGMSVDFFLDWAYLFFYFI